MNRIAEFEKVSYEQFKKDIFNIMPNAIEENIVRWYNNIKLPERATKGSAGYDFRTPFGFDLSNTFTRVIPTGIRCRFIDNSGYVLMCFPRSGMGFKYGFGLNNTVGIIDEDYYYADNEGHIMLSIKTNKMLVVNEGDKIAQGIFVPYGITLNDNSDKTRTGGFGSTGK